MKTNLFTSVVLTCGWCILNVACVGADTNDYWMHETNPLITDSGNDGGTDGQELRDGTDPLNPADDATGPIVTEQRGAAESHRGTPGPDLVTWFANGAWYLGVVGGAPGIPYSVSGRESCCSGTWTWVTQLMVGEGRLLIIPGRATYYYRLDIGSEDYDGDGLANIAEASFGTNPNLVDNSNGNSIADWREDTDQDGLPDSYEIMTGSNPRDPGTAPVLLPLDKCPLP